MRVMFTDGQFDALASFVFNVGAGGLQRSTLRRKVNREEHALVPAEFLKWVCGAGRRLKGLVRRREAKAQIMLLELTNAAARRPRDRDDLAERPRDGRF